MHPPFLLFKAFLFLSILFPTYFATDDERYTACTPFNCGNFTQISYPFWRDSQLEHCGHPMFKLVCFENKAIINITSEKFLVLDINFTTRILKIAREDLFGNLCPKNYNNISLDWDFYNYTSNDENSTLLYDCDPDVNTSKLATNFSFTCPINGKGPHPRDAYFVRQTNWADPSPLECRIYMRVPVLLLAVISFIMNSSLDVGYVLDQGFEIRWAVDEANCEDCKRSGGKCGHNVTTAEFRCFCPDQPYATACGHKLSPPSTCPSP
ncbi:hypothetical protein L6164_005350 [Bauhinia variegata]|uniref:Uncharacterized protein n=1 Tax=Bauhinia variegata TaxID=167791 RepID=A0ACB9PR12_BAUVA|nr:hypothetical protein L6164_005350 [Bauhinia variegata]